MGLSQWKSLAGQSKNSRINAKTKQANQTETHKQANKNNTCALAISVIAMTKYMNK